MRLLRVPAPWNRNHPDTPLITAIECYNEYAARELIRIGANLTALNGMKKPALYYAVRSGQDGIVEAILHVAPNLANPDPDGFTFLHLAVCSMGDFSLILEGNWGSEEIKEQMWEYYDEKTKKLPDRLPTVHYKGCLDAIDVLLKYNPRLMYSRDEDIGASPWDIVENPSAYSERMIGWNGASGTKLLPQPEGAPANTLLFNLQCVNVSVNWPDTITFNKLAH